MKSAVSCDELAWPDWLILSVLNGEEFDGLSSISVDSIGVSSMDRRSLEHWGSLTSEARNTPVARNRRTSGASGPRLLELAVVEAVARIERATAEAAWSKFLAVMRREKGRLTTARRLSLQKWGDVSSKAPAGLAHNWRRHDFVLKMFPKHRCDVSGPNAKETANIAEIDVVNLAELLETCEIRSSVMQRLEKDVLQILGDEGWYVAHDSQVYVYMGYKRSLMGWKKACLRAMIIPWCPHVVVRNGDKLASQQCLSTRHQHDVTMDHRALTRAYFAGLEELNETGRRKQNDKKVRRASIAFITESRSSNKETVAIPAPQTNSNEVTPAPRRTVPDANRKAAESAPPAGRRALGRRFFSLRRETAL